MLSLAVLWHITRRGNSTSTPDASDVQVIWGIIPSSNLGKSEEGLSHAVWIYSQICFHYNGSGYYTKTMADSRWTSRHCSKYDVSMTIAPIIPTYGRTTSIKSMYKSKVCSLVGSIHTWRWITNNMDYSGVHAWNSDGPSFFSYKANLYDQPFSPQTTWSHSCRVNTLLMGSGSLRAAYLTDSNLFFSTY